MLAIKKNILSTKYQKLIAESLEETIGFPLDVSIVTEEEFKSPAKAEEKAEKSPKKKSAPAA